MLAFQHMPRKMKTELPISMSDPLFFCASFVDERLLQAIKQNCFLHVYFCKQCFFSNLCFGLNMGGFLCLLVLPVALLILEGPVLSTNDAFWIPGLGNLSVMPRCLSSAMELMLSPPRVPDILIFFFSMFQHT